MSAGAEPVLSVVIPVHNGESTLGEQLDAVLAATEPSFEVVVVDNGSTDGTADLVRARALVDHRVRLVDASTKSGEAHARNEGVRAARTPFVAFCDADDVVADGWVHAMWQGLVEHDFVVGPIETYRLNPPWLAEMRGTALFSRMPHTVNDIPFGHGCNFGVRREVAASIGFDEGVRIGADADFSVRAHLAGVDLAWLPGATVHYRFRPTVRSRWTQAVAYGRASYHLHQVVGVEWGPVTRVRSQLRRIGWLVRSVPRLHRRDRRARWMWTLALVVGEIVGGDP